MTDFTCVDLFAGAGGLSEGLRQVGFNILAANDFDSHAANTFRYNHPEATFFEGPIQNVSAEDIFESTGMSRGDLFCLAGGPPCQAFSIYNHQRGMHDERSGLFREYIRLVEGLFPKWIVMENVTGISSVEGGLAIKEISRLLGELGYNVENYTLKSEQFGVPQERRRIFFIGNRLGLPNTFPSATYDGIKIKFTTVEDAIMDLPPLGVNDGIEKAEYLIPPISSYQKLMREGSIKLYNHVSPNLNDINLKRLAHISQGGSWRDIPFELLPAGMQRAKRSDHTKRYGRLALDGLSSTILTKCDPHWGAYFHPTQDRVISVREAARFQSFPDRFRFLGPRGEQYKQIGNAVPPLLAKAVGEEIIKITKHCMEHGGKLLEVNRFHCRVAGVSC
ncbi:MAG: DNA cytosine methyltransferase [Clostridiales bacterium]|jgi:DNA (cytosine-5)-methyltransferase 1|nr:DNA cytosine methyltransferase [Clostridiales bacterium]